MTNAMRNGVVRRGRGWGFVLDMGAQPATRCDDCDRRTWIEDDKRPSRCVCGGTLRETSERRQRWQHGFSTQEEAKRARAKALTVYSETGFDPLPKSVTAAEFAARWLEHQSTRLRPRAQARYSDLIRLHVLPVIGSVQLSKVSAGHVQAILDRASQSGLAPRTVLHVYRVLTTMLRSAVRWQLIAANPSAAVQPPRPSRPELSVPTPPQLRALIDAARDTVWESAMLLACSTGARRGEVLAVRWSDIDLDRARMRVVRSLSKLPASDPNPIRFEQPKTSRSRREVALPAFAVERLRVLRKQQAQARLALGTGWHEFGLVCTQGNGRPLSPAEFTRAFRRFATRVGLPQQTRLHDVRHAVATALLIAGVHPKVVSEALGHAAISITLDTYSHVVPSMGQAVADALQDALGGTL
jgi:integrase